MNAVAFDTLKLARKLEASGMDGAMAAGTAEALAEAMSGAELKADIFNLRGEFGVPRVEFGGLRTELRADIEILRRDVVIRFGSMLVIAVGVLITAFRYLPPHP